MDDMIIDKCVATTSSSKSIIRGGKILRMIIGHVQSHFPHVIGH